MTSSQKYHETAEALLERATGATYADQQVWIAAAQVHATLAQAAATRDLIEVVKAAHDLVDLA